MFGGSKKFDASKFKAQCNLALVRVRLQKQKKQNLSQVMKREIADLVRAGDEGTAQIKAEQLMHDDYLCEALEILETQLSELAIKSLVLANSTGTSPPPDLAEILATVIYAAPRLSIPEFTAVRDQLAVKYGKQYVFDCANDKGHCVQPNVKAKLSIGSGPDQEETVYFYLKSICELYHVPFTREIIGDAPDPVPDAAPDALPPPISFGGAATTSGAPSPFPTVPGAGAARSPFPSVPGAPAPAAAAAAASPFPSVPGAASATPSRAPVSAFPSVPGAGAPRPAASAFPSVPGAGASSPARATASAFPSVPGAGPASPSRATASAFPSVPGATARPATASAFPSVPGAGPSSPSRATASAFPSVPGARGAVPLPAPAAAPAPAFGAGPDPLDGLVLPGDDEIPDFDDLTSRMEAIKKRR